MRFRFVTAIMLLLVAGCSSDNNSSGPTGILAKITGVQTSGGILGSIKSGVVQAGQAGPSVNLPVSLSVINGGTSAIAVTSATSYYRVAIAIDGVEDYYEVLIPSGTTSTQLLITVAQSLTESSLPLAITAANASSNYGTTNHVTAEVTKVGSGDVQISLSWDTPSDVDLHVVGPDGNEIYYGNRTAASGGTLDLDSNAGCRIDNVNNENVTWPAGRSPSGSYTVRVDYWSNCLIASTNYVVTVTVARRAPQIFQGTLTGSGDFGGAGSGRTITTFTK